MLHASYKWIVSQLSSTRGLETFESFIQSRKEELEDVPSIDVVEIDAMGITLKDMECFWSSHTQSADLASSKFYWFQMQVLLECHKNPTMSAGDILEQALKNSTVNYSTHFVPASLLGGYEDMMVKGNGLGNLERSQPDYEPCLETRSELIIYQDQCPFEAKARGTDIILPSILDDYSIISGPMDYKKAFENTGNPSFHEDMLSNVCPHYNTDSQLDTCLEIAIAERELMDLQLSATARPKITLEISGQT